MAADGSSSGAERALLDLLGLAARAGRVVSGTEQVRKAVREGEVVRVILAADAAPAQHGKLIPLLEARGVPYHRLLSRGRLGGAIGRGPVTALGIADANFAQRAAVLITALTSLQD